MSADYQVEGTSQTARFTLKIYRGDGMALLAMNWKHGKPPNDFVGFAIEYKEPGGDRFYVLTNRLAFRGSGGTLNPNILSTKLSPIQMFRWVHFPRNANLDGPFLYRVTPVFMNERDELSYGDAQEAAIELRRETYPGQLNVAFTRGFVSSQAFVDRYQSAGPISTLLPATADEGLRFKPTHKKADEAYEWMGFEARRAILDLLDAAIADTTAQVRVVAYDLNEPQIVARLKKLGPRLQIIIDDSADHGATGSAENAAAQQLATSAGAARVKRQHMSGLQHNKTIIVTGTVQSVVCGSTNFSWRGLYVQSNAALVLHGAAAVKAFSDAFDRFWAADSASFGDTRSARWTTLQLTGISAKVTFSPHTSANAQLAAVASDIASNTSSSLLFSLAFLFQTPGPIRDSIKQVMDRNSAFVYGISDRRVGGLDVAKPDASVSPVFPAALTNAPKPFSDEPTGGGGIRMHHKFIVIDFNKASARVYTGSYNFSSPADLKNGENLLVIRDRRVAVSFAIEALRIFDHYHFRVVQQEAKKTKGGELTLKKPPRAPGEKPWWEPYYRDPRKIHDRQLFG